LTSLILPVGYVNTNPEFFQVSILTYTAASPSIPTGVTTGIAALSGGSLLVYLVNPAATLTFTAGDSLEIVLGGNTYKVIIKLWQDFLVGFPVILLVGACESGLF